MKGAKGVIVSITGGDDMRLMEVDEAANHIKELVDPDANIIWGSAFNPDLEGKIRVSVVATGIDGDAMQQGQEEARPFSLNQAAPRAFAAPTPAPSFAAAPRPSLRRPRILPIRLRRPRASPPAVAPCSNGCRACRAAVRAARTRVMTTVPMHRRSTSRAFSVARTISNPAARRVPAHPAGNWFPPATEYRTRPAVLSGLLRLQSLLQRATDGAIWL